MCVGGLGGWGQSRLLSCRDGLLEKPKKKEESFPIVTFRVIQEIIYGHFLSYLMKKYNKIQDFRQDQKYCSDPDVLTLCLTLVVMDVTLLPR